MKAQFEFSAEVSGKKHFLILPSSNIEITKKTAEKTALQLIKHNLINCWMYFGSTDVTLRIFSEQTTLLSAKFKTY